MTHTDEWGPWIEHDGSGQPNGLVGSYVSVVGIYGYSGAKAKAFEEVGHEKLVQSHSSPAWDWSNFGLLINGGREGKILRYRVRKPRGMAVLDAVMADLDTPIVEGVE